MGAPPERPSAAIRSAGLRRRAPRRFQQGFGAGEARCVLLIGGNRFVGLRLAWHLLGSGEEVTLLNRGHLPDPFGPRVRRRRGDRRTDLRRLVGGESFDAVVAFLAHPPEAPPPGYEHRAEESGLAGGQSPDPPS